MPPEAVSQETESESTETQESQESLEAQEQTTSTNNQQNQPTDREKALQAEVERLASYRQTLEAQLRENNQTINALRTSVERPTTQTQQQEEEEDPTEFFKSPRKFMREMIAHELKNQVAPLQEFVHGFRKESEIEKFIRSARTVPEYGDKINDRVASKLKEIFSQPNAVLNEQSFNVAAFTAIGMDSAGMLGASPTSVSDNGVTTQNPTSQAAPTTQNNENRNVNIPPHVRPTSPAPQPKQPKPSRKVTELEKRIMAENGFKTVEEYDKWLNMPATEVATSRFDKEQQK